VRVSISVHDEAEAFGKDPAATRLAGTLGLDKTMRQIRGSPR
jgi:hypothetical protein